jgi:pimeloyl-ACP methyl ester carboxylesterase
MPRIVILLLLCSLFSCQKTQLDTPPEATTNAVQTDRESATPNTPNPAAQGCDTYRPVVMVHGFLASGDTWAKFAQLFTSNGYCNRQMYAFDWNSLSAGANNTQALDALIDTIRNRLGVTQVDLIGHSAGGGVCYTYLTDAVRAAKVAHYVHVGSSVQSGPAGPSGMVPTLNLWSDGDEVATGGDIPGATNVMHPNLDHYQVATSPQSFGSVYEFFNGVVPTALSPTPENLICIGGRALTFGENVAAAGANIAMYYLDPATGQRVGAAAATLTADAEGRYLAINIEPNRPMEIVVAPASGRVIHYFREPFVRTSTFVYLRTLPGPLSPAGILLAGLPNSPNQSVFNCFLASQAAVAGRDSLLTDSIVLTTDQYASPAKTAISFFLYDGNNNSVSDQTPVGLFGSFTFLSGVDVWYQPSTSAPTVFRLNSRTQRIRKIPSNEGIEVVVFD